METKITYVNYAVILYTIGCIIFSVESVFEYHNAVVLFLWFTYIVTALCLIALAPLMSHKNYACSVFALIMFTLFHSSR